MLLTTLGVSARTTLRQFLRGCLLVATSSWLANLVGQPLAADDSSAPRAQVQPPVVSVSLELVQVDAVVTDGTGRRIDDLGCEDFEIYEDRKKQTISNCSFVRASDAPIATP